MPKLSPTASETIMLDVERILLLSIVDISQLICQRRYLGGHGLRQFCAAYGIEVARIAVVVARVIIADNNGVES